MVLILSDLYQEYFNTTYGNLTQHTAVITARSKYETGYSDTPFIMTRLAVGVQQNIRLLPIVKIFVFGHFLNLTQYLMEVTVLCFVGCNSISA